MRKVIREALKRGGWEPPSLYPDSYMPTQKKVLELTQWMHIRSSFMVGRAEGDVFEKIEEIQNEQPLRISYNLKFAPMRTAFRGNGVDYLAQDLSRRSIRGLITRLDNAGLLEWVNERTDSTQILNLAAWSLTEGESWVQMNNSTVVRAIVPEQGHVIEHDAVFVDVASFWKTPFWPLMCELVCRSCNAEIFMNLVREETWMLRSTFDYNDFGKKKMPTQAMQDRHARVRTAILEHAGYVDNEKELDKREEGRKMNTEQKRSFIQEGHNYVNAIMEQDFLQPWWDEAMEDLHRKSGKTVVQVLAPFFRKYPELKKELLELKRILRLIERYDLLARKSDFNGMISKAVQTVNDVQSDSDLYLNGFVWSGTNNHLVDESLDTRLQYHFENNTTIVAVQLRQVKDDRIIEYNNLDLYHLRSQIRKSIARWQQNFEHPLLKK